MKAYVAYRSVDYEGDLVLGVYSTPEKAQAALDADRARHGAAGDRWDTEEFEVDDPGIG